MTTVRVEIPHHLRRLAGVGPEVRLHLAGSPTLAAVLAALEEEHPALRGTVREMGSDRRRAYLRLHACGRDLSHDPPGAPLPEPVLRGEEPLRVLGAIAGG
jgi:sulfur-carrier protein